MCHELGVSKWDRPVRVRAWHLDTSYCAELSVSLNGIVQARRSTQVASTALLSGCRRRSKHVFQMHRQLLRREGIAACSLAAAVLSTHSQPRLPCSSQQPATTFNPALLLPHRTHTRTPSALSSPLPNEPSCSNSLRDRCHWLRGE